MPHTHPIQTIYPKKNTHLIEDLVVELTFTSKKTARNKLNRIQEWITNYLLQQLEELLNEYVTDSRILRLEQLVIDVGKVDQANFQVELSRKIIDAFTRIIKSGISGGEFFDSELLQGTIPPEQKSQFQAGGSRQLLEFLKTGHFPLQPVEGQKKLHEKLLQNCLLQGDLDYLLSDKSSLKIIAARLVKQFSSDTINQVLKSVAPGKYSDVVVMISILDSCLAHAGDVCREEIIYFFIKRYNEKISANWIHQIFDVIAKRLSMSTLNFFQLLVHEISKSSSVSAVHTAIYQSMNVLERFAIENNSVADEDCNQPLSVAVSAKNAILDTSTDIDNCAIHKEFDLTDGIGANSAGAGMTQSFWSGNESARKIFSSDKATLFSSSKTLIFSSNKATIFPSGKAAIFPSNKNPIFPSKKLPANNESYVHVTDQVGEAILYIFSSEKKRGSLFALLDGFSQVELNYFYIQLRSHSDVLRDKKFTLVDWITLIFFLLKEKNIIVSNDFNKLYLSAGHISIRYLKRFFLGLIELSSINSDAVSALISSMPASGLMDLAISLRTPLSSAKNHSNLTSDKYYPRIAFHQIKKITPAFIADNSGDMRRLLADIKKNNELLKRLQLDTESLRNMIDFYISINISNENSSELLSAISINAPADYLSNYLSTILLGLVNGHVIDVEFLGKRSVVAESLTNTLDPVSKEDQRYLKNIPVNIDQVAADHRHEPMLQNDIVASKIQDLYDDKTDDEGIGNREKMIDTYGISNKEVVVEQHTITGHARKIDQDVISNRPATIDLRMIADIGLTTDFGDHSTLQEIPAYHQENTSHKITEKKLASHRYVISTSTGATEREDVTDLKANDRHTEFNKRWQAMDSNTTNLRQSISDKKDELVFQNEVRNYIENNNRYKNINGLPLVHESEITDPEKYVDSLIEGSSYADISEESIDEKLICEEFIHEESIHEEPLHEKSIHEEAIHEEAIHKKSIHEESIYEEVIHKKSIHEESIYEEVIHKKSIHKESIHEKSITEPSSHIEGVPALGNVALTNISGLSELELFAICQDLFIGKININKLEGDVRDWQLLVITFINNYPDLPQNLKQHVIADITACVHIKSPPINFYKAIITSFLNNHSVDIEWMYESSMLIRRYLEKPVMPGITPSSEDAGDSLANTADINVSHINTVSADEHIDSEKYKHFSKATLDRKALGVQVSQEQVLNKRAFIKELLNKKALSKESSSKNALGKEPLIKELPNKELLGKELPDKELPDKELPDKELLNEEPNDVVLIATENRISTLASSNRTHTFSDETEIMLTPVNSLKEIDVVAYGPARKSNDGNDVDIGSDIATLLDKIRHKQIQLDDVVLNEQRWAELTGYMINNHEFFIQDFKQDIVNSIAVFLQKTSDPLLFYRYVISALLNDEILDLESIVQKVSVMSKDKNINRESSHQVSNYSQRSVADVKQDKQEGMSVMRFSQYDLLSRHEQDLLPLLIAPVVLTTPQLLQLKFLLDKVFFQRSAAASLNFSRFLADQDVIDNLVRYVPEYILERLLRHIRARELLQINNDIALIVKALELLSIQRNTYNIKSRGFISTKWTCVFSCIFQHPNTAVDIENLCLLLGNAAGCTDISLLINKVTELQSEKSVDTAMENAHRHSLVSESRSHKSYAPADEMSMVMNKSDSDIRIIESGIHLNNAGLILASPYLPRLFSMLALTAGGKFINTHAADRAAHLIQFMANGESQTPEYELVLNKILCGISTALPVSAGIEVTEAEKTLIEQMLSSMIQHWKILGNTSVDGLRQTFFQRQGWLRLEDDAWQLDVKESSFDMLLDQLPWSFSLTKFSWMDKPLHVSWRNKS